MLLFVFYLAVNQNGYASAFYSFEYFMPVFHVFENQGMCPDY